MNHFRDLLLDVWREACRHTEITEAAGNIARMLTRQMPVECLLVRRLDWAHGSLETVAVGRTSNRFPAQLTRTACSEAKLRRLVSWAKTGKLLHGDRPQRSGELALIAPEDYVGDIIAGPLVNQDGPSGILALVAAGQKTFREEHLKMVEALLEPFSAALENAHRLHELTALREAAEADRRTLLTRLGRREMGETIVGADAGLRPVMERVELVAQSDVPVLILGETGTGKEVVSRAIHNRSAREAGPFIRVNCGAIPPELIDSQLFGHEKGSFTGAGDTRKGWFERADGGTLFLDEMGELPLPAQVRLLRVLQDGYIERVGGQQPMHVDVRIVAATHRDLTLMVQAGTFREDLWYRVSVFPIRLPPLRDRLGDIPALASHFAERAAHRFGLTFTPPTLSDLQLLRKYSWPGNIRELGAVIDRAAILGDGRSLEVAKALGGDSAPPALRHIPQMPTLYEVTTDDLRQADPVAGPIVSLDQAMCQHMEKALIATRGKIEGPGGAAALLEINPHTLRARMRKHGIQWDRFRPGAAPNSGQEIY